MSRKPLSTFDLQAASRLKSIWDLRKSELGLTQEKAAEALGFSTQGAVSQYLNGRVPLNTDAVLKFARLLKVAPRDIRPEIESLLGDTEGYVNEGEGTFPRAPSEDDYALIPQYTAQGSCGPGMFNSHIEIKGALAFKRDWLSRLGVSPEACSVIYAKGDSMAPTIQEGEVLLIDHCQQTTHDGQVFALRRDGEVIVKRLIRAWPDGWVVRSDNPDKTRYPDAPVAAEHVAQIEVIGRVVWRGGGL